MKRLILLAAILTMTVPCADAAAQCCTAGNPVGTNCALPGSGGGQLNVTVSYMSSSSDTYYKGTQRLDKTYTESRYDFTSLSLSYGVTSALRVTADIGYYFEKAQRFVALDYTRTARGITDGTFGIQYRTYASDDALFEVLQTAKVTIPVGAFDQEYDGVVLPIDFQPSSGNYRYNVGVVLAKRFVSSPFSLFSFNSIEFSQAIETKNTYHKYGNLYNVSLMGVYRVSDALQTLLQLRCEMRDRALTGTIDRLPAGQSKNNQYSYITASGGVTAYIAPQIAFTAFGGWTFALQYNYPFYKNVYGEEQLTTRQAVSVNLSRTIDFGGGTDEAGAPESDTALPSFTLAVRGNCDMCKERIEKTAMAVPSVLSAVWNDETKLLTVRWRDTRPDGDAIEKALAAAGHDTANHTAPEEVYNNLPECCQYR